MTETQPLGALTPRAQRHVAYAVRVAQEGGMPVAGTEHLLLAMLRDQHSVAYQVIAAETAIDPILTRLTEILSSPPYIGEEN